MSLPKFRIWDETDDDWLTDDWGPHAPDALVDEEATEERTRDNNSSLYMQWVPLKGLVFEQWVGLSDAKGVSVFEGDVIREEWDAPAGHLVSDSLVKHGAYEDGEGYNVIGFYRDYALRAAVTAGESGAPISVINTSRWTVIGNRHENKDLLT